MSNGERAQGLRFDRDHGVTTHAILFLSDLDPEAIGDAGAHATHYEAVPPADFHDFMASLPPEAIEGSTFVDVGAGMGRAVLLASTYPFVQVAGVEISPGLYEIAKENLANVRELRQRCWDVRVARADARIWHYPPGNLVVFMYNPFDELALAQTLDAIVESRKPGDAIWLLYHTASHEEVLAKFAFMQIQRHRFGLIASRTVSSRA